MTQTATRSAYGVVTEPATLTIQRRLPGPVERVWKYLTESELRRQWLAAGDMEMKVGSAFQFTWRNDELNAPRGNRPDGAAAEHSMECRITELDPPRAIGFTWGRSDGVTFTLETAKDGAVLLTVIHRRLPDRDTTLKVSAGWHMHLDVLVACLTGEQSDPFWEGWSRLKAEYETRIPG